MADYLEKIAAEWQERSSELADWVMTHLVDRTDVWGRYVRRRGEDGDDGTAVITAPFRDERGKVFLDADSLRKHFKVRSGVGVFGVHGASADQTSRWFAIDIDLHDEDDLSVTREGKFRRAGLVPGAVGAGLRSPAARFQRHRRVPRAGAVRPAHVDQERPRVR